LTLTQVWASGATRSTLAVTGAVAVGAVYPLTARALHPVVLPLLVAGAGLAALAMRRIEIGVAVAMPLVALNSDLAGPLPWLPGLAWAALLLLRPRALVLFLPLAITLALALAPEALAERFESGSGSGSELSSRTDIWRTADAIWREEPVLGAGVGSFPTAYSEVRVPGKEFLPDTNFGPPPHGHNLYLHLLAELGLLGAGLFVGLLAAAAHRAMALRRSVDRWVAAHGRGMLAAMAAFAIHNVFDVTLLEQAGSYVWALLGLVSAVAVVARTEEVAA